MHATGDFAGATQLLVLTLGGNHITSAAADAFSNLKALQFEPEKLNATNADGSKYISSYGIGLWTHVRRTLQKGLAFYGGNQSFGFAPISYAPNPAECLWIGPLVSDLNCSFCILGTEIASASNTTCIRPAFRPYSGWDGSSEQAQLRLLDKSGDTIQVDRGNGTGANASILLARHTYNIPAPKLSPKDLKFVGYKQPFLKIQYELDYSLGAEVDVGCGTTVVGDGALDQNIPKDQQPNHPQTMREWAYQFPHAGRGNLKAKDYGYYPARCPRYFRFRVTHPGNFSFVRRRALGLLASVLRLLDVGVASCLLGLADRPPCCS